GTGPGRPCRCNDRHEMDCTVISREAHRADARGVKEVASAEFLIMVRMPISLDGQLVVAISSRALFDFEEENQVFEASDDRAYMSLQLDRLDQPARVGVAF